MIVHLFHTFQYLVIAKPASFHTIDDCTHFMTEQLVHLNGLPQFIGVDEAHHCTLD